MSRSCGGLGGGGCDCGYKQPAKQPSTRGSGCCGTIKVQGKCITCPPTCGCGCQQPATHPCPGKCDGCGTSKVKGKCITCPPTCDSGCQQPAILQSKSTTSSWSPTTTPPSPPPPTPPSPPSTPPSPSSPPTAPSPPSTAPSPTPTPPSPPPTPLPTKNKRPRRPPRPSITERVKDDVASSPPWHTTIVPRSQHYVVMLDIAVTISNVLIPSMGVEKAEVINTFLFVASFNTLFQTLFGARLPVVMGSSFSSVVPTLYIASSRRFLKYTDQKQKFKHAMRTEQGAQIISSLFQIALGYSGLWKKYARSLSPLAAAPLVTHTGLGLFARGFPEVSLLNPLFH